jgi:hypothetical protein
VCLVLDLSIHVYINVLASVDATCMMEVFKCPPACIFAAVKHLHVFLLQSNACMYFILFSYTALASMIDQYDFLHVFDVGPNVHDNNTK